MKNRQEDLTPKPKAASEPPPMFDIFKALGEYFKPLNEKQNDLLNRP
jgi:hypothetical protein